MTDGVNIDWSLLKAPDYVGDFVDAFQAGRNMAAPASANAFGPAPRAEAAHADPMAAPLASMSAPERDRAAERADLLQSLGTGLRAYPYVARAGILAHLAPTLIAQGIPAAALAGFDPTDQALDGAIAQARGIAGRLASPA